MHVYTYHCLFLYKEASWPSGDRPAGSKGYFYLFVIIRLTSGCSTLVWLLLYLLCLREIGESIKYSTIQKLKKG